MLTDNIFEDIALEPSALVPKSVLDPSFLYICKQLESCLRAPFTYRIDDKTFPEYDLNPLDLDKTNIPARKVQYELYCQKRSNQSNKTEELLNENAYFWTPPHSDEDDNEVPKADDNGKFLDVRVTKLMKGVIINSRVYLGNNNWNTILSGDAHFRECFVCSELVELDKEDLLRHIDSSSHKKNLDEHKPLAVFELTVTRMIQHFYHCGVCNELLPITDDSNHYLSETHAHKLLHAQCKAFRLLNNRKDKHCNMGNGNGYAIVSKKKARRKIRNRKKGGAKKLYDSNSDSSDYFCDEDDLSILDYRKTNVSYAEIVKHETENNNSERNAEYGDYDKDLSDISKDDQREEYTNYDLSTPNRGNPAASYADMVKLYEDAPKYVELELNERRIRMTHDSWHMVITPKLNRFNCMICTEYGHIVSKKAHCESDTHLKKLQECTILNSHPNIFVRQVSDKFYHCGVCNNFQLIDRIEYHIERNHPELFRKTSNTGNESNKTIK